MYYGVSVDPSQEVVPLLKLRKLVSLLYVELNDVSQVSQVSQLAGLKETLTKRFIVTIALPNNQDVEAFFAQLYESLHLLKPFKYIVLNIPTSVLLTLHPSLLKRHLDKLRSQINHLSIQIPLVNDNKLWVIFQQLKVPDLNVAFEITADHIDKHILQLWSVEQLQYIKTRYSPSTNLLINSIFSIYNSQIPLILPDLDNITQFKLIQPNPTYNLLIDPLQPLRDDLDSGIYDQFEKDITKYDQYEAAMDLAIDDLIGQYMLDPLVVLVVGPGNGGILDRLLKIVEAHPLCNFKVYAVEKNPKCYRILKTYNSIKWNNKVTIIMDDIRFVSLSFHPHLIVSELLGSFGDNELCPEILARFNTNTVQKPCLMIPNSYTTYLQPIYSNIDIPGYDQPYIVNLTRYYPICEFQEVWTWEHPSSIINTTFSTKLNFDIYNNEDCEVTGFYGYFKANLYGHINIQIIDPMDTTTYCKSWYPILFPVRRSKVQKISKFELSISRLSDDHKAWYEWEFMGVHYNKDRCSYIDAS